MKKLLSLLLAVITILSLCACQNKQAPATQPPQAEQAPVFQIGYGREDITPKNLGAPLGGYGQSNKRKHDEVLDPLMVTAVAITGTNNETIILMSVDVISSSQHKMIRQNIERECGVPFDHIMLAATHTHSAPDQNQSSNGAFVTNYINLAVSAAKKAMADRSPAEVFIGETQTERINFVRHYEMNDGTFCGDNFGSEKSGYKGHAETGDHQLQVVKFARAAEDKNDIIMVNFQAHPCLTGGIDKLKLSADFIGSTRMQLEYQMKCDFIYFTGAAGNQNTKSRITGETRTTDYQEYATILCEYIRNALDNAKPVAATTVTAREDTLMGVVNRQMEDRLAEATEVSALYQATDRATGNKLAHEYGLSSVYHANGIINRSNILEDELPIVLTTYAFGDVAVTASPYEMFADHGRYIKENTPYEMAIVASCANGAMGYLPTQKAFNYGCYESHTGKFTGDTGQRCAEMLVDMMTTMQGES